MEPAGNVTESEAVEEAEAALAAADEAFGRFDLESVIAHLSTAIRAFTAAGLPCRAAMACVQLGDTYANGLGNRTAARAWFSRAARMVEDQPECVEQGWVAVAALGCDVDDPARLLAGAELALDRARRFGDVNLETKALADAGLAHVQAGRMAEGMILLDEAMALACGPADQVETVAKSVCSFFTACYYTADYARADSWSPLLRQRGLIGTSSGSTVFLSTHCDSVQATALMELGRWSDAEALLVRAKAVFAATLPTPNWHADIALGDLRIRQGRLAEAEQLLLGRDQSIQALLPMARLHLARGDVELARSAARRGVRAMRDDRPRAAELLTVVVDAELARGDLPAAETACVDLEARLDGVTAPAVRARAAVARARVRVAHGDVAGAIETLEAALDELARHDLPVARLSLLLELVRLRDRAGDHAGALVDATAAGSLRATLDIVLAAGDEALLARRTSAPSRATTGQEVATLVRERTGWSASCAGTTVRLQDTKGLRYLAELVSRPGVEQHALDLVDRVEGVSTDGIDRRALGDAGPAMDARARAAYRTRIEALRGDLEDALAADRLETAERLQDELDQLVRQLAQAFGLGGRERPTGSAAEKARLNVTRALRAAITKVAEMLPVPGGVLDRRLRTGLYCVYAPAAEDEVRWIVQS